jgi:uncharacterized protein YdhG (YjbR/CyaY superfamily)
MGKTGTMSVEAYIASQPNALRVALTHVRVAIRNGVPEAEELISYDMPAYKFRGEALLQFAGWKRHYSLYLATKRIVAAFADELEPYDVKKGTIGFPLSEPVPEKLIGRIAEFRANEIANREIL